MTLWVIFDRDEANSRPRHVGYALRAEVRWTRSNVGQRLGFGEYSTGLFLRAILSNVVPNQEDGSAPGPTIHSFI